VPRFSLIGITSFGFQTVFRQCCRSFTRHTFRTAD
jgi:hypothetical protein